MEQVVTLKEQNNSRPTITGGTLAAPAFESLEFRNVSFSYSIGQKQKFAVSHVNLKISRGEKIAIVGYNGAGKTTLTKLIMRLYDPDEGEILYNGRNLKEYTLESIRHRMAAVFQDYRIFACSVGENVAGGRYDGQSAGKVLEAHGELTAAGGRYAHMFRLQAEKYRE